MFVSFFSLPLFIAYSILFLFVSIKANLKVFQYK